MRVRFPTTTARFFLEPSFSPSSRTSTTDTYAQFSLSLLLGTVQSRPTGRGPNGIMQRDQCASHHRHEYPELRGGYPGLSLSIKIMSQLRMNRAKKLSRICRVFDGGLVGQAVFHNLPPASGSRGLARLGSSSLLAAFLRAIAAGIIQLLQTL